MSSNPPYLATGVWVPSCAPVTLADFDNATALAFNPASWDFYSSNSSWWIPGAVLGGLSALGFICFTVWLFTLCCRRHHWQHELETLPASWSADGSKRTHKRWSIGNILIILLFLAIVAFCIWGMVEGIKMTSNTISGFWAVVFKADQRINFINKAAKALATGVTAVNNALLTISTSALANASALTIPGSQLINGENTTVGGAVARVVEVAPEAIRNTAGNISANFMTPLRDSLSAAASSIESVAVDGLGGFINDFYPPTTTFSETWRWILIAVFFGVVLVNALLAVLAALSAKWPRTAATLTCFLWFFVALLLLIGAGVMPLGEGLTSQGCLYAETFVLRMVYENVANPDPIVKALRFYFGGPGVTDRIAQELYNINTTAVAAINSTMQPVRDWLESPQGTVFLRSVPQASQALQDLQNLRGELQAVLANTSFVEDAVKQSDFQTIFQEGKTWACCGLHDTSYNLWIAWTATGCAGLLLCTLLTLKVVSLCNFK